MTCHPAVLQGRYIHEATKRIPIIGDGDTGYGNAMNVKRTVKGYAAAGFAGDWGTGGGGRLGRWVAVESAQQRGLQVRATDTFELSSRGQGGAFGGGMWMIALYVMHTGCGDAHGEFAAVNCCRCCCC
jgi:hypothetical protein